MAATRGRMVAVGVYMAAPKARMATFGVHMVAIGACTAP